MNLSSVWEHHGRDNDLTNGAKACIFNPDGVFGIHTQQNHRSGSITTKNSESIPAADPKTRARQLDPRSPRAFAATRTGSELACSASRHIHGSASRNSQQAPLKIGTLTALTARKMCNLALSMRQSSVFQRFRLPISRHDQRRWRRDGWAICSGGRFRPKLLKEMRRVACLAKCLQSAEIRASPVKRSSVRMREGQRCASRQFDRRWIRSAKKMWGSAPFFNTRDNQGRLRLEGSRGSAMRMRSQS